MSETEIVNVDDSVSDAVMEFFRENGRFPDDEELDKIIADNIEE